jgi:hypothetical protein
MALTYEQIATYTLPSDAASYTFTSIPQTYDDLILHASFANQTNNTVLYVQLGNGSVNTGGVYSFTRLYNSGGGGSGYTSVSTGFQLVSNAGPSLEYPTVSYANFPNYSQSSYWKTFLSKNADQYNGGCDFVGGSFQSTEVINAMKLVPNSGNILAGSMFTLYGIKRA